MTKIKEVFNLTMPFSMIAITFIVIGLFSKNDLLIELGDVFGLIGVAVYFIRKKKQVRNGQK